jgi:purine-binding chemotaxis protein CheW
MAELMAAAQAEAMPGREGKYLTFSLAGEEYGIGILKVKEIIGMLDITRVPQTPSYVKGVINLRGKVIPVIDLRAKFGLEAGSYTERTCVVVVEVLREGGQVLIGSVVDSVTEVLNIREGEIEETPDFGVQFDTRYLLGMAKAGGNIKLLLDIDRVLGHENLSALQLRG